MVPSRRVGNFYNCLFPDPPSRRLVPTLLTRNVVEQKILKFLDALSPLPYTSMKMFFAVNRIRYGSKRS
jgi:hypothetical protein